MSTVSYSNSQTIPASEYESDEEGRGNFAGYKYPTSKSSQGSIDVDSESEATMSEDDECVVNKVSASFTFKAGAAQNQAQQRIQRQPQQHVNLVWENSAVSETSWTDEKHSLYLKSIEEIFVQSLYERGQYIYSCKRWESGRITTSVSGKSLYEDVEPGISCDWQPFNLFPDEETKAQIRCNDEEIQSRRKRFRFESIWIKQGHQKVDINGDLSGRVNNCKSSKEPACKGYAETGDVPNEYTLKIQMGRFKDTYKLDHATNKEISERDVQEDQVVPSLENISPTS